MNKTFHSNNPRFNACVGYNGNYQIDTYAHGYGESVIALFKSVQNHEIALDAAVYPILYSARHFLELTLKCQLGLLNEINGNISPGLQRVIKATHSINELWHEYCSLARVDTRINDYISKLHEYVMDFSQIDDNGETFRYPYSNDNNKHLIGLSCIDLRDACIRFNEMKDLFEELDWVCNTLVEEYAQGSFLEGKSRFEIKQIAQDLPDYTEWKNESFKNIKFELQKKHKISSNQLSKIISFIKGHREFSGYIGIDNSIDEIEKGKFEKLIRDYASAINDAPSKEYCAWHEKWTKHFCVKYHKKELAACAILYEIGYFNLHSECYERSLPKFLKMTKKDIISVYILMNGIVMEKVEIALQILNQSSLLNVIKVYKYSNKWPIV